MGTHFTLIKGSGHDLLVIGDELPENKVRQILLRSDDESLYTIWCFDDEISDPDGNDLLFDDLNGEEWLVKYP